MNAYFHYLIMTTHKFVILAEDMKRNSYCLGRKEGVEIGTTIGQTKDVRVAFDWWFWFKWFNLLVVFLLPLGKVYPSAIFTIVKVALFRASVEKAQKSEIGKYLIQAKILHFKNIPTINRWNHDQPPPLLLVLKIY